jgi:hypothetical protein
LRDATGDALRRDEARVKLAKHKSGTRIGYGYICACVPPRPVTVSSSPPPPLESKFLGFPSPLTGSKNLRGIKALLPHLFRRHTLRQLDLVSQLLQIMGGFISSRLDLGLHYCALCVPYWLLCKIIERNGGLVLKLLPMRHYSALNYFLIPCKMMKGTVLSQTRYMFRGYSFHSRYI